METALGVGAVMNAGRRDAAAAGLYRGAVGAIAGSGTGRGAGPRTPARTGAESVPCCGRPAASAPRVRQDPDERDRQNRPRASARESRARVDHRVEPSMFIGMRRPSAARASLDPARHARVASRHHAGGDRLVDELEQPRERGSTG